MPRVVAYVILCVLTGVAAYLLFGDDQRAHEAVDGTEPVVGEAGPVLRASGQADARGAGEAVLDPRVLLARFRSDKADERKKAYDALAKDQRVGFDEEFVRLMVERLASSDPALAQGAYMALFHTGPATIPFLGPLLHSETGHVRVQALRLFEEWRSRGMRDLTYPLLVPFLDDPDQGVRAAAAQLVVGGIPDEDGVAAYLLDHLDDGWVGHGEPAICLARMGQRGVEHVVAMLRNPEQAMRGLRGLRFASAEGLKPYLRRLVPFIEDASDERLQAAAIAALEPLVGDCKDLLPSLIKVLGGESAPARFEVLKVLLAMGENAMPAMKSVLALLDDEEDSIAGLAVSFLATLKSSPATVLPALPGALDSAVGERAGSAMATFGAAAVPYLKSALGDSEADVRYFALGGVQRLGPIVSALAGDVMALLNDEEFDVQIRAARVVGGLGRAGVSAIPVLLRLLDDGTLPPGMAASVLLPMGSAAERAVLEALRSGNEGMRLRIVDMLAKSSGRSAFAIDDVAPYLRHAEARVRRTAIFAVYQTTGAAAVSEGTRPGIDPELRKRVLALLAALPEDPDAYNAKLVQAFVRALASPDRRSLSVLCLPGSRGPGEAGSRRPRPRTGRCSSFPSVLTCAGPLRRLDQERSGVRACASSAHSSPSRSLHGCLLPTPTMRSPRQPSLPL